MRCKRCSHVSKAEPRIRAVKSCAVRLLDRKAQEDAWHVPCAPAASPHRVKFCRATGLDKTASFQPLLPQLRTCPGVIGRLTLSADPCNAAKSVHGLQIRLIPEFARAGNGNR